MQNESCPASDGCELAFQTSIPVREVITNGRTSRHGFPPCVLLLHGFSGSSDYFVRNVDVLARRGLWVVAPDMRGHGRSGHTRGGYHVARLAADLRDFVAHLKRAAPDVPFVPVGCSIGAAVLWTYVELFGEGDFAGFVFVDQAPLQDLSPFEGWDASKCHTGCYDEATMQAAQNAWLTDPSVAHVGLVQSCLGYRHAPDGKDGVSDDQRAADQSFFTGISALCDPVWLARLLADHTRYDHREAIECISVPVLVMAGRRSGCFPLEGMLETVSRAEKGHRERKGETKPGGQDALAKASVFDSGHWLFYEEPERFNREVADFVALTCQKG